MPLNHATGNMYPWIDFTWNPIGGRCPHECRYCYASPDDMKKPVLIKKYTGEPRVWSTEKKTNLGHGNTIFVQNMSDLFAEGVPDDVIAWVLEHCSEYPDNKYLFQSKNPGRFIGWKFPPNIILGTTIETNRAGLLSQVSNAPDPWQRATVMANLYPDTMISVEPIMDFDPDKFSQMLIGINPKFISIGADSQNKDLLEPTWSRVELLIAMLKDTGLDVKVKDNMQRLKDESDALHKLWK